MIWILQVLFSPLPTPALFTLIALGALTFLWVLSRPKPVLPPVDLNKQSVGIEVMLILLVGMDYFWQTCSKYQSILTLDISGNSHFCYTQPSLLCNSAVLCIEGKSYDTKRKRQKLLPTGLGVLFTRSPWLSLTFFLYYKCFLFVSWLMIDQDGRLHVTMQVVALNVSQGLFSNLQLNINLGNLENSSAYE